MNINGTPVLTKTTSDGRTVTVTGRPHDHPAVYLSGEWWTSGAVVERRDSRPGITHSIGGPSRILGLTTAEAQQVRDGMAAITAAYDATDEGQRVKLAVALSMAGGRYSAASEAVTGEGDWTPYREARAAYESAAADLDAFDAAHPELAARIAAEQAKKDQELLEAGLRA